MKFVKGQILPVQMFGKMRFGKIVGISERFGQVQYELESCDGSLNPFRTIKNKENWNATGEWTGGGPYETIEKHVKRYLKESL